MTVAELIAELQKMPAGATVIVTGHDYDESFYERPAVRVGKAIPSSGDRWYRAADDGAKGETVVIIE